jgi:hypothetical protein
LSLCILTVGAQSITCTQSTGWPVLACTFSNFFVQARISLNFCVGRAEKSLVVIVRLLAGALCNVNDASGGDPLTVAAKRTAVAAHIVVIKGRPLTGDRRTWGSQIFVRVRL